MTNVIVALDLHDAAEALALVDRVGPAVQYYKVGSQLFTAAGPDVVRELRARDKKVFLDLKYHDIPHTVARAVEAAARLGVDLLTLHVSGGSAMLQAARDAAGPDGPRLIGVTILTSAAAADIEEVWGKELRSLREEVSRLAALAADAGLQGVVASALEADVLKRRHGTEFLVLTPGVRPQGAVIGDQIRTATPAAAARAGADFIIVGRPVLTAEQPVEVVQAILDEIRSVGE